MKFEQTWMLSSVLCLGLLTIRLRSTSGEAAPQIGQSPVPLGLGAPGLRSSNNAAAGPNWGLSPSYGVPGLTNFGPAAGGAGTVPGAVGAGLDNAFSQKLALYMVKKQKLLSLLNSIAGILQAKADQKYAKANTLQNTNFGLGRQQTLFPINNNINSLNSIISPFASLLGGLGGVGGGLGGGAGLVRNNNAAWAA